MLEQINKENFQHMLGRFDTNQLESMIEKFPYFQQAHLLLAKKYQQQNNPKFDQQLQLAALYIQDRELLYDLFNEKNTASAQVQKTIVEPVKADAAKAETNAVIITAPEIVDAQKVEPESITTAAESNHQKINEDNTDVKRQIELIEASARILNQIIEKTLEESKEDTTTTIITAPEAVMLDKVEIEEAPFSEQIIIDEIKEDDSDLKHQIEIIEESARRLTGIVENTVGAKAEAEKLSPPDEEEKTQPIIALPAEQMEEEITEEVAQQESAPVSLFSRIKPHTFNEWLKAFNNKSVTEINESPVEEPTNADEDELTQLLTANISVDYLHHLVKEETTYAKGLEKFIDEQIQKHKQPEVKKIAPKKHFSTNPATETMAKVYEMQKKYAKAIATYEALTLKFPEKSSLFAARITYLKNIV
jgi:hypothetical protein